MSTIELDENNVVVDPSSGRHILDVDSVIEHQADGGNVICIRLSRRKANTKKILPNRVYHRNGQLFLGNSPLSVESFSFEFKNSTEYISMSLRRGLTTPPVLPEHDMLAEISDYVRSIVGNASVDRFIRGEGVLPGMECGCGGDNVDIVDGHWICRDCLAEGSIHIAKTQNHNTPCNEVQNPSITNWEMI